MDYVKYWIEMGCMKNTDDNSRQYPTTLYFGKYHKQSADNRMPNQHYHMVQGAANHQARMARHAAALSPNLVH